MKLDSLFDVSYVNSISLLFSVPYIEQPDSDHFRYLLLLFFAVGEEGEDALRQSEMSTNEITALMFWRNGSSDLSVCYEKNKQRAEQL